MNTTDQSIISTCNTILFDTCSILEGHSFTACINSILSLSISGLKIFLPYAVWNELSFLAHSNTSNCPEKAQIAVDELQRLLQSDILAFIGEPSVCEHTDHFFIRFAATQCFDRKMVIITQDGDLSKDLLSISNITAKLGAPIFVRNLDTHGDLIQKYSCANAGTNSSIRAILSRYGV